ncbi:MAG: response regulator, partial [Chloroflexota bacterium]
LQQHGYQLKATRTGALGIAAAKAERPDLVLLDIMMPDMDGYEVCRQLRADPRLASVPIIMFTAKSQVRDRLTGFEAGADDYLTKPTQPGELLKRMRALLARPSDEAGVVTAASESGRPAPTGDQPPSPVGRPSPYLTAVLGARGGAGATTTAINLAMGLAESGYDTTLVDLDFYQAHVGQFLNLAVAAGLNALADRPVAEWPSQLGQSMIQYEDRLRLLLGKPNLDGRWPIFSAEQGAALADRLVEQHAYVVADLGHALTPIHQLFLARAGQLFLCVRPERLAVVAARSLLQGFKSNWLPGRALHVLMLSFGENLALPQAAVEETLGHPVTAFITISQPEMAQAVNRATPLLRLRPDSPAAGHFRQLARQIVKRET